MEMKLQLSGETMRHFHVAQIFEESHKHKKSLSFSRDGQRLVVCDHKNLSIFNCATCTLICQVHMHPYRPEAVCFTPKEDRLLHSATKMDYAIRYLNLSTRQYVRLFSGHQLDVLDLCLQPGSDHCFVSAGRDKRLLLWDLRTSQPTQQLEEVQNPLIACDPTGRVIATCKTSKCIELYDVRMLETNPCQRFRYQVDSPATWTQLQFSPDGKALLVATDYSCCFSVDAYNGGILQAYTGWRNSRHLPLKTCYTPDSQFILAGADRGCVHVWHASSGRTIEVLQSNSSLPIQCIRFHPEQMMFVTCDVRTCWWQIREKRQREREEDAEQTVERQERLHRHEKEVEWMMEEEQRMKREREQRDKEQRDKEQRDKEQRDKEQRDKEQRDKQMEEQRVKQKEEGEQRKRQEEQNKQQEQLEKQITEEEDQEEIELLVQKEEQEEIEQQAEKERMQPVEKEQREKQLQQAQVQKEPLPKKRLRSAIEIPIIDLTCIEDSSSSEEDEELETAHKQWEDDHKWVRGTMVRRRIVSVPPCPIKFPRPRRWQLWRQRRSPYEEGELPDN